jgi:hypothetical protein
MIERRGARGACGERAFGGTDSCADIHSHEPAPSTTVASRCNGVRPATRHGQYLTSTAEGQGTLAAPLVEAHPNTHTPTRGSQAVTHAVHSVLHHPLLIPSNVHLTRLDICCAQCKGCGEGVRGNKGRPTPAVTAHARRTPHSHVHRASARPPRQAPSSPIKPHQAPRQGAHCAAWYSSRHPPRSCRIFTVQP